MDNTVISGEYGCDLVSQCLSFTEIPPQSVAFISGDYQADLLKLVDADTLPKHWGGTRVDEDGDERCSSMVRSL